MEVLKQTSPTFSPGAPRARPSKREPSSRTRTARPCALLWPSKDLSCSECGAASPFGAARWRALRRAAQYGKNTPYCWKNIAPISPFYPSAIKGRAAYTALDAWRQWRVGAALTMVARPYKKMLKMDRGSTENPARALRRLGRESMKRRLSLIALCALMGLSATSALAGGWLGVTVTPPRGVAVAEIIKESPADRAGLQRGDVILTVDGHQVQNAGHFAHLINSGRPGDAAKLEVQRDGKKLTLEAPLDDSRDHAVMNGGGNGGWGEMINRATQMLPRPSMNSAPMNGSLYAAPQTGGYGAPEADPHYAPPPSAYGYPEVTPQQQRSDFSGSVRPGGRQHFFGMNPNAAPQSGLAPAPTAPPAAATPTQPAERPEAALAPNPADAPWLGLAMAPDPNGVRIAAVAPHSPAQRAGLQKGDLLTRFNGETVADPDQVAKTVMAMRPGELVTLSLTRQGDAQTIQMALGARPAR
ncbi:putative PDZ/DHR/GLGF domain-containing protein [Magnetofaba australis IT-1]|uniref:Putative PDZ/DHR/GLGF domain-containing protein n=2 Tax=Magnetofaba TaxID=1472292 RepID=A0A1Y2K334_9PROT|nr:putative PDZ/DHR/GLGF domain-containing protein [Magnetofaba australis IT-1]